MSTRAESTLNKDDIATIDAILKTGNRVELIPTKEGVRIIKVIRHKMQPAQK